MVLVVLQNCLEVIKQDSALAIFSQIYVRTHTPQRTGIFLRDIPLNKCLSSHLHVKWETYALGKKTLVSDDENERFFIVWKEHNHNRQHFRTRSLHIYGALSRNEKSAQDESAMFLRSKKWHLCCSCCVCTHFVPRQRCSQTPAGRPPFAFS